MVLTIVGLVFLAAGAPMIWLAQHTFARDRAIARWPRADGVVTSATVESWSYLTNDQNTGQDYYATSYMPSVCYTYSVGGQTFGGKGIARAIDGVSMDNNSAMRIIEKYPPQSKVAVLYDPTDPKTAYLEVRRSGGASFLFAFGLMWIALGTLCTMLSLLV